MKSYPSVPSHKERKIALGQHCIGYYKYDGSNLRWEWNKKRGFYKFGTRNRLFGVDEEPYNQGISIMLQNHGPQITRIVQKEYIGIQDFVVYTEFFGSGSFAGNHKLDEEKHLILIDVWIPRKGFIVPRLFNKFFGNLEFAPEVLYEGNYNQQLINDVRVGNYPVNEGMMCKGVDERGNQWMVKIKTERYLDRLKDKYGANWEKYE